MIRGQTKSDCLKHHLLLCSLMTFAIPSCSTSRNNAAPGILDGSVNSAVDAHDAQLSIDNGQARDTLAQLTFEGIYYGSYQGKLSTGDQTGGSVMLEILADQTVKATVYTPEGEFTYANGEIKGPQGQLTKGTVTFTLNSSTEATLTVNGDITYSSSDGKNTTSTLTATGTFNFSNGQAIVSGAWQTSLGSTGTWKSYHHKAECEKICQLYLSCGFKGPGNLDECLYGCAIPEMAALFTCIHSDSTCEQAKNCIENGGTLDKVYVSTKGSDEKEGTTASSAKKTLGAALKVVKAGGQILVEAGTYPECLQIAKPVILTGSYDETFSTSDPLAHPSILDGQKQCRPLELLGLTGSISIELENFIVENGDSKTAVMDTDGGCISISFLNFTLKRSIVRNCHSTGSGGGLKVYQGKLVVMDSSFLSNQAEGNAGGAIDIGEGTTFTITNTDVSSNEGVSWGGGINAWNASGRLEGCEIKNNTAQKGGGGINIGPDPTGNEKSQYVLKNCVIKDNNPNNINGVFVDEGGNG